MIIRPKSIQKTKSFLVRLSDKEHKLFKQASWKEGMILSHCYRMLIKNYIRKTLPKEFEVAFRNDK